MKNIHWLKKGSKIKKIKEEYKLYRMRKKIRFNFYDRDDSTIVKWIHDWIERLGPQHEKQIIDLNITNQAVVKQGELLENLEVDDQQPSIYRNVYEGSTTNNRVLTEKSEDSNVDTSALPFERK